MVQPTGNRIFNALGRLESAVLVSQDDFQVTFCVRHSTAGNRTSSQHRRTGFLAASVTQRRKNRSVSHAILMSLNIASPRDCPFL